MTRVKICGITNSEDALQAVGCGADALGFVFAASRRRVTIEQAREITSQLPPYVCKVGVFVDQDIDEVKGTMSACSLDVAQLHGSETPEYCGELFPQVVKAFRVKDRASLDELPRYRVSGYLLDSYVEDLPGGTGTSFNWDLAHEATRFGPIILSGGLHAGNVLLAIARVRPYGVDVSTGVEASPGKKDPARVRDFIQAVRQENR
ncbi:MAG: phosphoribosylanthranilate isomerase [Chloroflexi bacterium]|nr:phosphoribosylanthranilate isomerase [Chloroflexota bacterium]